MTQSPMLSAAGSITDRYHSSFNHLLHLTSIVRTGKATSALDQLALVALHLESGQGTTVTAEVVAEALAVYFGSPRTAAEVQRCLDEHIRTSAVVKTPDGGYALSAATAAAVQKRADEGHHLEAEIREEWIRQLDEDDLLPAVSSGQLWDCLKQYLARVFCRHGALSIQVLDPDIPTDEVEVDLELLMDEAIAQSQLEQHRHQVAPAITSFFRNKTACRSKYLAELLDGTFTFFALQSTRASDAYVGELKPLTLFLDTNFIISLIGADTHQSQDAARDLIRFIRDNDLPCTIYYHAETYKEVERTLNAVGRYLCSRSWTPEVSRAALDSGAGSGITLKYHELNAQHPTSPREYMKRFSNVAVLLEEYDVKIYRPAGGAESDLEEISTLIADYGSFVKSRRQDEKPYEALDHDIRVWLAVRERRRRLGAGSTVMDAGAFLLTNDRLFRAFISGRTTQGHVPTVVVPEQLAQVLRPFGPPDFDWDAKFIETFAVPEFRTAASDYGDTSTKLMECLALYKDLPYETAVKLLSDQLFLDQLSGTTTDKEFAEAVETTIVEENKSLTRELDQLKQERDGLRSRLDESEEHAESEREALQERVRELEDAVAKAERGQRLQVEGREALAGLRTERDTTRDDLEKLKTSLRYGVGAVTASLLLALVLAGPVVMGWEWLLEHDRRVALQASGVFGALLVGLRIAFWDKITGRDAVVSLVLMLLVGVITLL